MDSTYTYKIDCSRLAPDEFRKIYNSLDSIYEFCFIIPGVPRCFTILKCPDEPELSSVFTAPPGCRISQK